MLKVKFKNSKKLLKIFSTIEKIVNKNENNSNLKYVKLSKICDKLNIFVMNTNMKLNYIVDETLEIEGDYNLYECKKLLPLLNVLEGEINIENEIIENDKCRYIIPAINKDFPEFIMPQLLYDKEINTNEFKNAIINVLPATSEADGVLSGVYIDNNKVVSCDQNRVFIKKISDTKLSIVLSKEVINEFLKLPFEDKVYINTFKNNIYIEDKNLLLVGSYINKPYPNYESVFPKEEKNIINLNLKTLEEALIYLAPIIDNEIPKCVLNFNKNILNLKTNNNGCCADTTIFCESNIEDTLEVKFSFKYLNDMIKANEEKIKITTYSDNIGFLFESKDAKQYIMPML